MSLVKAANTTSKVVRAYNSLAPSTKQAINQVAQRAAATVARQISSSNTRGPRARSSTVRRTRQGQRIYAPEESVTTKAIAPVSYATMWQSGAKSMRVKQTEVIGFITADEKSWAEKWIPWVRVGDYSVASFPINPANPNVFPWLSYIARLYDKYRFHSLKFRFINSVSTMQAGNIAFALDYDTLDAPPKSIVEASQTAKYQIGPTYCPQEFTVPVTHPGNNPWLYTYDINADSNKVDLKTYNLGNTFVMINGVKHGDKVPLGWLAVDYDVELLDKNPVVSDKVFASMTFDSGVQPSKKTRSNVDPADTMEVGIDWVHPADNTHNTNVCRLTLDQNLPVGTRLRFGLYLSAVVNNAHNATNTKLTIATTPEGVQILENTSPSVALAANSTDNQVTGYWNFDITITDSHVIELEVSLTNSTYLRYSYTGDYWKYHAMAYTYA